MASMMVMKDEMWSQESILCCEFVYQMSAGAVPGKSSCLSRMKGHTHEQVLHNQRQIAYWERH